MSTQALCMLTWQKRQNSYWLIWWCVVAESLLPKLCTPLQPFYFHFYRILPTGLTWKNHRTGLEEMDVLGLWDHFTCRETPMESFIPADVLLFHSVVFDTCLWRLVLESFETLSSHHPSYHSSLSRTFFLPCIYSSITTYSNQWWDAM